MFRWPLGVFQEIVEQTGFDLLFDELKVFRGVARRRESNCERERKHDTSPSAQRGQSKA
jgi:hypothetical protein